LSLLQARELGQGKPRNRLWPVDRQRICSLSRHRTIGVCMRCGSKSFTDSTESIAEDADHREYKSCRESRCRLALGAYFPGPALFPAIVGEVSCARAG